MAQSIRENVQPTAGQHARRDDIIRAPDERRIFPVREAQRHLQNKERRWAPFVYAAFLLALVAVFIGAYTSYAFSKYRNEVLPGVHVDTVDISGMTSQQATIVIYSQLQAMYYKPVKLVYNSWTWQPRKEEIGVSYLVPQTVKAALQVGRHESLAEQLFDRMPFHPEHSVPLIYQLDQKKLIAYLRAKVSPKVLRPLLNARLAVQNNQVVLIPSQAGVQIDLLKTQNAVTSGMGYLNRQTRVVSVDHVTPIVDDVAAIAVRDRVNRFLSQTPVIKIGKLDIATTRADFAPMFGFHDVIDNNKATIQMTVDSSKVQAYVGSLASRVDRQAANARMDFSGGTVSVISQRVVGRTLNQTAAISALTSVLTHLKPGAKLKFNVARTQPSVDLSNPASLGISTLLSTGVTSFPGAGDTRLNDITAIAQELNGRLLPPNEDISFNQLTSGTVWDPRVYQDTEVDDGTGHPMPGPSGAMQQVATTVLRALYGTGLTLEERHAHSHQMDWYEPPIGYDAVVAPDRNWDLRFMNNTGKYLLLQTRVEPIRQELDVYVYGPKLGWKVAVDRYGKITKSIPHGPKQMKPDSSLLPGEERQTQFAHTGAVTDVQRTITYPSGKVTVDDIKTVYEPWDAVILVGPGASAEPTPSPTAKSAARPTPRPTSPSPPGAVPEVTPTP